MYSTSSHHSYSEAVKIMLHHPSSKHLVRVECNATFLVDLLKLDHADDIKADDCGHWIHNGRKNTKVVVWKNGSQIIRVVLTSKNRKSPPDENSLVRVYYIHDPHSDYKRIFYYLYGMLSQCMLVLVYYFIYYYYADVDVNKIRLNCCLVCYGFEKDVHRILPRPHGNSKGKQPYARTQQSTIEKIKQSSSMSPKDTLSSVAEEVGGLVCARSIGSLPKSREQVSYYKRKSKNESSGSSVQTSDVLYNVMLQCKAAHSSGVFVRMVVAAPEPMSILCTDQQLDDMVRFLLNSQ